MVVGFAFMTGADDGCGSVELESAKSYMKNKEYKEAKDAINREIATNPKSDEAYYMLGTINYEQREYLEAKKNLNKSLELNPASPNKDKITDIVRSMWAQEFNDGVRVFNDGIKEPDEAKKNALLDTAELRFKSAVELNPDSAKTYGVLASVYSARKQSAKAVTLFDEAITRSPNDSEPYRALMTLYVSDLKENPDSFNKAIEVGEKARAKGIATEQIYLLLISSYVDAKRLKDAAPALTEAEPKFPKNHIFPFYSGVIYNDALDFTNAVVKFESALKIKDTFSEAAYNGAVAYARLAEADKKAHPDEAPKKGKKAPPSYTGHFPLYEKGLALIKPAAERDNKKEQWALTGQILGALGRSDEAKAALEKAK